MKCNPITYEWVFLFQSVQAPNGMIAHLFGPIEGRCHDAFMLGKSGLLPKLYHITKPNGELYVLHGDPAYGLSRNILAPFRGAIWNGVLEKFCRTLPL